MRYINLLLTLISIDCGTAGAQQQTRAVSRCQLTQEAEHRLVKLPARDDILQRSIVGRGISCSNCSRTICYYTLDLLLTRVAAFLVRSLTTA